MSELTVSYGEVAVRLLVTAALCGVIGFMRETRDQSVGFRTHILLDLGAALFTLVSAYGFTEFTEAALESGGRGIQFDPTRIAAQIVTGIGFLGAGAIIRQGTDVRGLTTAASLWAAAAIGMAVGAGYYFGAAATSAGVNVATEILERHGVQVRSLDVKIEGGRTTYAIQLRIPPRSSGVQGALEEISALPSIERVSIERVSIERVSISGLHEVE